MSGIRVYVYCKNHSIKLKDITDSKNSIRVCITILVFYETIIFKRGRLGISIYYGFILYDLITLTVICLKIKIS